MKIFDCVGCGRFETYRSAIGSDGEKCCAFNMLSLSTAKHTTHTYVYFRTSISIFDGELWRTGRRKRNQKANTQFDISFAGTYQLLALYVTTVALFAAFFSGESIWMTHSRCDTNNKVKEISFLIHLHLHHGRHHRCSSDTSELNGLNFGWIRYTKIVVLILDNFRVLIWKKAATVAQPCGQMKMRTIYLMGEDVGYLCRKRDSVTLKIIP